MKRLLIVDSNSILNRAFYGISMLTSPKGVPTNAIYGFLHSLEARMNEVEPDLCVAAFDLKGPTFRHGLYPEYKAGRRPTPLELNVQFPIAKELLGAMGIFVAQSEGYEADDILGTLAAEAEKEGYDEIYLYTGDRDSLQLISGKTRVLLAKSGDCVVYDRDVFFDHYGIYPENYIYAKALMGDSSDNIPGVPGIGEKTAMKIIAEYLDIDRLYSELDAGGCASLKGSAREKIINGRDLAYLSLKLATIDRSADLGFTLADAEKCVPDPTAAASIMADLGFTRMYASFSRLFGKSSAQQPAETGARQELPVVKIDVPGAFAGISYENRVSAYLEDDGTVSVLNGTDRYSFARDLLCAFLDSLPESSELELFDLKAWCRAAGRRIDRGVFDVMLAAYLTDPGAGTPSLEKLAALYRVGSAGNADTVSHLATVLREKLGELGCLKHLYDIEIPVARILYDMEKRGFLVDTDGLISFGKTLTGMADRISREIYTEAGHEFNINSPKQLGTVLFEEMGLGHAKKTKTGYSTSSDVLEKMAPYYDIVSLVLEYRHITKLNSTFVNGLLEAADENGRVHTTFNQCVTATGRLSSTDPNLQNIPIRTELGSRMREFFIAGSGCLLCDADYSQIELRVMAHMSGDEHMSEAFKNGADIHASTAARVFGVKEDEVTPELRKRAKAINFGIIYGMGNFSLAEDLGITRKQAAEYIDSYMNEYPGIREYLDRTVSDASVNGFVTTITGRRRYIPELRSQNRNIRAFGERVAMNSPVQGSAADIIKTAMVRVAARLEKEIPDAHLLLQVHDELIVESPSASADRAAAILKEEMENAVHLSVPLPAETSVGANWLECH